MTKEAFLNISQWRNDNLLEGSVYSPFLDHEIVISIGFYQSKDNKELSDFAIRSINEFLRLDKSDFHWIKTELWRRCDVTFQNASYGLNGVPRKEGQSEYEANKDFFVIHNQEDAFKKSKGKYLFIDNDNAGQSETCFWLEYETPWDREHNTIFIFRNGKQYSVE